jgi:hypothetical protein
MRQDVFANVAQLAFVEIGVDKRSSDTQARCNPSTYATNANAEHLLHWLQQNVKDVHKKTKQAM